MIKVESKIVEKEDGAHVDSNLTYDVSSPQQFEEEAEAAVWNIIMFMANHSELNEREILMSLLADLEDDDIPSLYSEEEVEYE